jgi:hypothetical protein
MALHPAGSRRPVAGWSLLCLLSACGLGVEATGESGSGGGGGSSGSGGGGGAGGTGNPLAIVLDFKVTNTSSQARTQTVLASVPFPEGGYQLADLDNLIVSGRQTAWLPMQQWADGRVKIAQAQFTDDFEAGETKSYVVARDENAETGTFTRNNWVANGANDLEIGAEVRDTFQVSYRSFATGAGEVLQSTPFVRTKRWRTYHTSTQTGIGRDYLSSTYYVTEFRDMPFMVVDWILGNDYLGADVVPAGNTDPNLRPLGHIDVKLARFLCRGATQVLPYRPATEGIAPPVMVGNYETFRVMQDDWIGDGQNRRYRFVLRFEPSSAPTGEAVRWQRSATAMVEHPLFALASPTAWLQTKAAGLLGGPIRGPSDATSRARTFLDNWAGNTTWFGTWGSRSDPKQTATTGTPRNHPMCEELGRAIQGEFPPLLLRLEQMAWTQAMRPYHLWNLQVGAEQSILLYSGLPFHVSAESLGRRRLRDQDPYPQYRTAVPPATVSDPLFPHGFNGYDGEHWTTDLLFDYWTISGDAWALSELQQLGQSLKGLLRLSYYATANMQAARTEGWCMQSFAQIYQATRDEALKTFAMRRVNEIVDVQRKKNHPSKAIVFQPNYPSTGYPLNHEFFMPWQHGSILYGYLGAYKAFGAPILLEIAEDVVETVQYSWVSNVQLPNGTPVPHGLRYYVPVTHNGASIQPNYWDGLPGGIKFGDSPLGGAHTFLIGGLHHLADITNDNSVRTRALLYGSTLLGTVTDNSRWNKWVFCVPPSYAP